MKAWKVLAVFIFTVALVMLIGCGKAEEQPAQEAEPESIPVEKTVADYVPTGEDIGTEAACAVCGAALKVSETTPAVVYDNEVYYFCTAEEKAAFTAAPQNYVTGAEGIGTEAKPEEKTGD
jgi:YHS domain-containing protein